MKKYLYIISLLTLFSTTLFSQKELEMNWYLNNSDSSFKNKDNIFSCLPWDIVELASKEIIFTTYNYEGWKIQKIDKSSGKVIWKNSRNPNYPDSTQRMFVLDNIFKRSDGNIDVIGVKSRQQDYSSIKDGNPIRIVYDANTGKEIQYIEMQQPQGLTGVVAKPGIARGFIPKQDGKNYYLLSRVREGNASIILRTLDSNLVVKDTLTWFFKGKDANNPSVGIYDGTAPLRINNDIYFIISVWKGTKDTSSYPHYFIHVDSDGKIKSEKNIGKSLYYLLDYSNYTTVRNGFLISGIADTTLNQFRNPNTASNTAIVAKIDTSGIKIWETRLLHPLGKLFEVIETSEDINRNGYWAFAGNTNEENPYLFFINQSGIAQYVGKVKLANNNKYFFPSQSWSLTDGSLLLGFKYNKCIPYCWGVGLVEGNKLDKLLSNSNVIENDLNNVSIYPNPANDKLIIEFENSTSGKVNIVNNIGQVLQSSSFREQISLNLATEQYPNGIYFLHFSLDNKIEFSKKIVIQH